jgi:hypothetical protein
MEMTPVKSSAADAIGYDPKTRKLQVNYRGGRSYTFHDVDPGEHQALMGASSIGAHLNKHIAPGRKFSENHD